MWNNGFAVRFTIHENNIDFTLIPYKQNDVKPGLFLLNKKQKNDFEEKMSCLNKTILDDVKLEKEFETFFLSIKERYSSYMELYSNKYLNAMRKRKLFPSLIRKKKRVLFLNLIRCEAHRDIMLKLLKN
jgi:poly-gamma-glutamate synthesis protein (capsule biosynthesis protein)